jgi:methionyl-tRNA formyltransferase
MRVVFVATGDIALPTWEWLMASGVEVVALVTQPDKPQGRRMELTPPAIKLRAMAAGVRVMQPISLRKKSAIDAVAALCPDLIVVMAYGQILTERFLSLAPMGCINVHASLLPRHRGAACIQAAIDAGDEESGITLMHMARALDAGDIILQKKRLIRENETGGSLHDALAELAPGALAELLQDLREGTAERIPQDEARVTHVGKLQREDGLLDWSQSAFLLERRIRAYDPWPGTFAVMEGGTRVKIFPPTRMVEAESLAVGESRVTAGELWIGCGEGALILTQVQAEGGKRIAAMDFARGQRGEIRFVHI